MQGGVHPAGQDHLGVERLGNRRQVHDLLGPHADREHEAPDQRPSQGDEDGTSHEMEGPPAAVPGGRIRLQQHE